MATLVLTTVGHVIGGPIGGALGALAGQAIDARLFRGAAREGPRLTELAVQTSSYGTQIPKLFGTMRVAGTVIWSTDLIETRTASRGGKGQPGTNTYSYAASFAVALSARPIIGVRRIWAEGKLLRGAAGDWKGRTGFRLHPGGEDQAVDPLIAAAMGATPAYRGIAYAVFEGMQLADYGNRIPSLTFEVEADAGPVVSGDVAAALAGEVSARGGTMLGGFAASGASVRGVLETLSVLDGGWWQPEGGRLVRRDDDGPALGVVDAGISGAGRRRTVASDAPREVTVAHYDAARDYQIGVQRMRRSGTRERVERIELPAVLDATVAKGVAAALIVRGEAERTRRRVGLGVDGLAVAPGAIVTIAGEAGRWRVASSSVVGLATTLDLVPLASGPAAAMPASSGIVLGAPDVVAGRTVLIVAELPSPPDRLLSGPRVSMLATGEGAGWRQAALLYSLDDGTSWMSAGASAAPATIGRIETPPVPASSLLIDRRSRIVVALLRADMALGDADAAGLAGMANLALLGDEVIQFERAEPLGGGRWALSGLRRGLRGTEAAIGTQSAGDRFALLEDDAIAAIDLPPAAIGRRVRFLASGVGDIDAPAAAELTPGGASVAPPSPVHVGAHVDDTGALTLGWIRRSRRGWGWNDGIDVPLAEEAEAYRVTIVSSDGVERSIATAVPRLTIGAAERPSGRAMVRIVQQGTFAASLPATLILEEGA
ncbi:phage tail protein [Sphingomonas sp. A2-49]|uniref:phage tail protein n=1 Tax=Sphingomonas sp. A2-49 TaxID=1391375 RepID=UPI0021D373BB|nr:phage tail protein [Sphingomonas sp. A2-49]MCU6455857.1 phage tail protein [Sphingomonas sp. A2-49]